MVGSARKSARKVPAKCLLGPMWTVMATRARPETGTKVRFRDGSGGIGNQPRWSRVFPPNKGPQCGRFHSQVGSRSSADGPFGGTTVGRNETNGPATDQTSRERMTCGR
ncbi:hypothetical protein GCM10012286_57880 [Streptomyces lasiicapitis]|uniref:Secreted protein n=1 Tax=Streptomyces lasiicapitis TaxID=1923961 RepID=A0ABQ2MI47_9ACTN|nr:hypothetical protein GCM10012286_57880 [Streptomyces lasiicapitis]